MLNETVFKRSNATAEQRQTALSVPQVVTSEILMASEMQSCPIEVTKIPISR